MDSGSEHEFDFNNKFDFNKLRAGQYRFIYYDDCKLLFDNIYIIHHANDDSKLHDFKYNFKYNSDQSYEL